MRVGSVAGAVLAAVWAAAAYGQTFEVASLKAAAVGMPGKEDAARKVVFGPGGVTMQAASLPEMVAAAYGVKDYQVAGPEWMKSERFDVVAKAGAGTDTAAMRGMLQELLAERFQLKVHRETKEMSVDELTVAKNGPKLGEKKGAGESAVGLDGGKMTFRNFSMGKLAEYLSARSPDRPVVDATELDGYYDLAVRLTDSEDVIEVKKAIGGAMRDGSLGRLVAQQTGLRIETRKKPLEVIVVDHAERAPAGN